MKPVEWKTYRTRFLIKAKQLSSSLSFVDALGRQHSGRKGDYLVESSDGVVSIAPRQIFEDIYVPMSRADEHPIVLSNHDVRKNDVQKLDLQQEDFRSPDLRANDLRNSDLRSDNLRSHGRLNDVASDGPPADLRPDDLRRKLPQPCRERRTPAPRLDLM